MLESAQKKVFYADGGVAGTKRVAVLISLAGFPVTHFRRISDCLRTLKRDRCDLLLTNVREPAVEGIRLLGEAKCLLPTLPVIVLVDRDDISTTIRAMKAGATGCLERPPKPAQLVATIRDALRSSTPRGIHLTPMERRVLGFVLEGRTSGEVAAVLKRSPRTVEVHRRNIMRKFRTKNIVELVRKCVSCRLPGAEEGGVLCSGSIDNCRFYSRAVKP